MSEVDVIEDRLRRTFAAVGAAVPADVHQADDRLDDAAPTPTSVAPRPRARVAVLAAAGAVLVASLLVVQNRSGRFPSDVDTANRQTGTSIGPLGTGRPATDDVPTIATLAETARRTPALVPPAGGYQHLRTRTTTLSTTLIVRESGQFPDSRDQLQAVDADQWVAADGSGRTDAVQTALGQDGRRLDEQPVGYGAPYANIQAPGAVPWGADALAELPTTPEALRDWFVNAGLGDPGAAGDDLVPPIARLLSWPATPPMSRAAALALLGGQPGLRVQRDDPGGSHLRLTVADRWVVLAAADTQVESYGQTSAAGVVVQSVVIDQRNVTAMLPPAPPPKTGAELIAEAEAASAAATTPGSVPAATTTSPPDGSHVRVAFTAIHRAPLTPLIDVWVWAPEPGHVPPTPVERVEAVESGSWRMLYWHLTIASSGPTERTAGGQLRTTIDVEVPPEAAQWIVSVQTQHLVVAVAPSLPNDQIPCRGACTDQLGVIPE